MYQEINSNEIEKKNVKEINTKMTIRLLWLNIVFGIIFVVATYFILLEKKSFVLSSDSYIPFFTTAFFTLFFLGYHYYAEKNVILSIDDKEKELQELQTMMKSDKTIISTFPLVLLALGILLRDEVPCGSCENSFLKEKLRLILNLFLLSTLFGLIIPFLIDTLVIDYDNLERLLLFENLEFISISYGFGYIVLLLVTVYVNNKEKKITK